MKPIDILLIEDNEGDILLTRDALREGRIANDLKVVKDGLEAIKYLLKEGEYSHSTTPDLILLDINLPKLNGHEVLKRIKSQEEIKHLPVIMLSTSSSQNDILNSYKNYANCYISKPLDVEDFINVIFSIKEFWLTIVKLPETK